MIFLSKSSQPRSMANLTVRLIFIVFTLLVALLLGFSYQFSSTAVTQEVERNLTQTAALLQNQFDYKLGTMQSTQNSQSKSVSLLEYVESSDVPALDDYFLTIDKADLKNTPDFRFIARHQELLWDDGNSPFFGIDRSHLRKLISEVAYSDSWNFSVLETDSGNKHLLLRRMPLVKDRTGQVIGKLFVALVLDNNFSLVENLKIVSNTQEIVLLANGKPIASTVKLDRDLLIRIHQAENPDKIYDNDLLYNNLMLRIDGIPTPIGIYFLQDNQNLLSLESNYRIGLLFSVISILLTALLARFLIQKRITSELTALMAYTQVAKDERKVSRFHGSIVSEFDHIGHTLEATFSELLEKEKLFQDLFNFALSPIIVWNGEGRIIRMNPAAEKAFQQKGIHIERDFQAFQQRIIAPIKMVSTGAVLTGINIPIAKTVYRWNLSPISFENKVDTIIGQGLDITSLVEAERQSNIAREEAEKSATARTDFMARISHEIRTPLNGILGISELLKKSELSEEQAEKVDVLSQSGEHLLAVLNDILDFSKIERGKLKVEKSQFLLSEVVNSIENIYLPLCKDKSVALNVVNRVEDEIKLYSDPMRLNQILFNLMSNAIKFTHSGRIDINFSIERPVPGTSRLVVRVRDTGIGISEKNLGSIFEPFVQSEKTSIREYGGSGLGLSIVKLLTEMLGGEIKVESEEHVGTRFVVSIPVEVIDERKMLPPDSKNGKSAEFFGRKLSMLLVEDNATNAFIARAFCEKYGMSVDWANDGPSALEKLSLTEYDLIMMDNQMPNMDGIEATRIIREKMGLSTPIIACTADGYEDTRVAFLESGADYVLVKPIKEAPLHEALLFFRETFLQGE